MKRIGVFLLVMVFCLSLCGCGVISNPYDRTESTTDDNSQTPSQTQTQKPDTGASSNEQPQGQTNNNKPQDNTAALRQQQIAAAKTAFEALRLAEEACVAAMDSIYPAWHFAVYESGKFTYATDCYKAYIEATKLDYDRTLELLNADLEDLNREVNGQTQIAYLEDIGTAVDLVLLVCYDNGTFSAVEQNLITAKEALKSVTDQFEGDTGYADLKKYYAEVASYFEYIKNPTGSFDNLGNLVNTYETNIRTYRISLEMLLK